MAKVSKIMKKYLSGKISFKTAVARLEHLGLTRDEAQFKVIGWSNIKRNA